jgi:hypothetical protein
MRSVKALVTLALAVAVVGDPAAATTTVRAGEDLQQALNGARAGDTILLERGATFTGNFVLPARSGSDARDVVLRTAGDTGLPAPGQRIAPHMSSRLAKIQSPNNRAALRTAPGAAHWRIELVEFPANADPAGDIIDLGDGSSQQRDLTQVASAITLDRIYVHGDPQRGQKRGVALNSAGTTITGSYIAEIKIVGQDSQAIGGWNGPGNYLIENNYLEAAGENVAFGGSDPAIVGLTPGNIVIRGNTLSKPLAWRDSSPRWQIKNLLELKNARAVLIERNIFERSWKQAQTGYAIVFTVRNQDGGCPWCQVEDVRFRGNLVRDSGAGVVILGIDSPFPSRQTNHIDIRDNLFEGIDKSWGGDGTVLLLTDRPRDIVVDHNTIIQGDSSALVKMGSGRVDGFTFTNNVASHGTYGIVGSDHTTGMDSINAYLPGADIRANVIAGGNARVYPPGNLFPTIDEWRQQFVAFASRDYHLGPSSPWRAAGTDKRDLGADLTQLPLGGGRSALPDTTSGQAVPRRPGQ